MPNSSKKSIPSRPSTIDSTSNPLTTRTVDLNSSVNSIIILVLLAAAATRLASALGDLAIDEIWSWYFASQAIHKLSDVFALRHDNNHLLNTIVMYTLGPAVPDIVYRLPAALGSIASVITATWIAGRRGNGVNSLFTSVLVGASYLLILYGSEARGYSYAVVFGYLSWFCLLRMDKTRDWRDALGFALCASLGFLGHLTFLYCFAGFAVWGLWKWLVRPSWLIPIAFVPPTTVAGLLYLYFIRGMAIGGGPESTLISALISTLSLVSGGPMYDDLALLMAGLSTVWLAAGFVHLWRTDRAIALSHVTIIVAAPAIVLFFTGHQLIYPRYFLIPIAFALLVMGDVSASWWKQGGRFGQLCTVGMVGLFLVGNANWTRLLIPDGRGDYSGAMRWMAQQTSEPPATVSSDHDFRNGLIFAYYSERLWSKEPPLRYLDQRTLQGRPTDWLIRHNFEGDPTLPSQLVDPAGNAYELQRVFPHRSLTGWNWRVYRKSNANLKQAQFR
ncbi:hypothetical protein [Schlesneria sp. T3-172]|uniref:hypothetical protein n=1 Tax=Schlesneria sphaerica TaxID=3373610 RepID=UPI0037C77562